jgi:methionyl-tRNA formyltransferase
METRVVFMGSPLFAEPSLIALNNSFKVIGVVTQPDRPSGRGRSISHSAVKSLAEKLKLPVFQPKTLKDPVAVDHIRQWKPDIIVVAAFGQILRRQILELSPHGCINVHASLLPRWRGASPIQYAILNGDHITGVTIMKMDEGVDTGGILAQESIPILDDDTAFSLTTRLSELGADLLVDTLPGYLNQTIIPIEQDDTQSTYAPLINKEDGQLDLAKPAKHLENQVRALLPWPGAFVMVNNQVMKIHKAHAVSSPQHTSVDNEKGDANTAILNGEPALVTTDGFLILDQVQPPGKKIMSGKDFLRGYRNWS